VLVLFLSHFFALGVYGLTVGLLELGRVLKAWPGWRSAVSTVLVLAAPVAVLLAVLRATGGAIGGSVSEWQFGSKLLWPVVFLNGYNIYLAAGSMVAIAVLAAYLVLKREVQIVSGGGLVLIGLAAAYVLMPFKLFDSRMADIRMITAIFLIGPAFLSFKIAGWRSQAAAMAVSLVILVNAGYAAIVWLSYRADYADLKASFAQLEPSSFVLVASSGTGPTLLLDMPFDRAPVLAVHYAKAFVSSFYTIAGMQPVEVKPGLARLDVSTTTEDYRPPSLATLRELASGEAAPGSLGYLRAWTHDFHYVYLMGPHVQDAMPGILREIATSRRFTLYAVQG
jgi:hypothetical protein